MLKSLAFALACSALAGCATVPPPVTIRQPVEVKVAVPVPCVSSVPEPPVRATDRELLTGSGAQVFDKVWADHLSSRDYEASLVAALTACVGAPAKPAEK